MNQKTIALLTSSEGHFSISEAIRQTLEPHYNVAVFQKPIFMRHAYVLMYRFFPQLFRFPYEMSRKSNRSEIARHLYDRFYGDEILAFLRQLQPDFFINTYFMYLESLKKYSQETGIGFLNVVANPRGLHPIEISDTARHNVSFDDWGWFVRDEYEQDYDPVALKKELGLDSEVLTILLAGGSEGNQKLAHLLPTLLLHQKPLNIIVVSGSNKTMKNIIDTILKGYKRADKKIINLGFTKELHRYLQAADLIVGKAGPNLLFEAVATKTPFFAISHIAGQEDGNLAVIEEHTIGVVEENMTKAAQLLKDIIENPASLATFQPGLKKLALHNRQAKTRLLNYIKEQVSS